MKFRGIKKQLFIFLLVMFTQKDFSQPTTYIQSWNNAQFTQSLNEKWNTELYSRAIFTSTSENKNPFAVFSLFMIRGWGHYNLHSRWKLSLGFSYYDYWDAPEINQVNGNEYRISLQGTNYFHKTNYTLLTRMRLEDRFISTIDYEARYRYRQQLKYLQPFNSETITDGIFYGIVSEEVFLNLNNSSEIDISFDKNRITFGMGYAITNDFLIELNYLNEYLIRSPENIIQHILSVTFIFNNIIKAKKKINRTESENE